MKKRFYLLLLSLPLLLTVGCSNEDEASLGDRQPVTFSGTVAEGTALQTKMAGSSWEAGDAIGIYMKKAGEALSSAPEQNRKYTTQDGGDSFAPESGKDPIYYPQGGNVDFIAYYPYKEGMEATNLYSVDVSDQSNLGAIDLLYSNDAAGIAKSKRPVSLTFEHQLSKVVLTIQGNGMNEEVIKSMTIQLTGMPTTADFDLEAGSIDNQGTAEDINMGTTSEAILVPHTGTDFQNRSMKFTIKNATYTHNLSDDANFLPGKQYNYTVTVNRTGIQIEKEEITDWDDSDYKPSYAIGDFYPDNANPIGVVFWVSRDKKEGKIVSLDETEAAWGPSVEIKANNRENGQVNMQTLQNYMNNNQQQWEDFPAFDWVHRRNPDGVNYTADATDIWYLPSRYELQQLHYQKETINKRLAENGGTELSTKGYLSSLESGIYNAWIVSVFSGGQSSYSKNRVHRVRAVLAF